MRQQRDPSVGNVLKKQPPLFVKNKDGSTSVYVHALPGKRYREGMRSSYVNSWVAQDFLSCYGVERVELNNLIQGVNLKGIGFKKSLYTPSVNVSTTRFCPMETERQKMFRIDVCRKECRKYYDVLRTPDFPKAIYRRGNTLFYKNSLSPALLKTKEIDRIVFQPELSF